MKGIIWAAAVGAAACLLGCKTDTGAAGYSSEVMEHPGGRIAQNPDPSRGERGFLITGTVVSDTRDVLRIKDEQGFERALRIRDDTMFHQPDGDLIAREYLAPGSQVRAAFDYNNKERIAREIIILSEADAGQQAPPSWPEDPTPWRRDP